MTKRQLADHVLRLADPTEALWRPCEDKWPGTFPLTTRDCGATATHQREDGKWVCDCHDPKTAPRIVTQEEQMRGCLSEYEDDHEN